MSQAPIELKGSSFTLSVIHLYHPEPETVRQALQDKIDQAPDFLKNAPVVLNVSALNDEVNWPLLQRAIASTGLYVVGVSGCKSDQLKCLIVEAGLPLLSEGKLSKKQDKSLTKGVESVHVQSESFKTRFINTPVRSGQQIYAKNCDLIVTNSVSAGAELIADGNIHIYGMMRGRALAGASGDRQCQIFCSSLSAELVSIAGEYWIMDQIPVNFFGKASRLYLLDDVITIEQLF